MEHKTDWGSALAIAFIAISVIYMLATGGGKVAPGSDLCGSGATLAC